MQMKGGTTDAAKYADYRYLGHPWRLNKTNQMPPLDGYVTVHL